VEDRLREAICAGHFEPGQRLVERELCERMGVGRTSVREGLRQLEAEGLVVTIPHRGPFVRGIGVEEAAELYAARALIEGYAGRRMAELATPAEIATLAAAVTALEAAAATGDRGSLIAAKTAFYRILMKGCRNSFLEDMLQQLNNRITVLRFTSMTQPGRLERSLVEIRAIHQAIAARLPDEAEAACRQHIEAAAAVALAVLGRQAGAATKTSKQREDNHD
jgi:DNA-binding GntR family transcriptional regulator